MKVLLFNRGDVCVYKDGKKVPVKLQNDREYIEINATDGEKIKLLFLRRSEFSSKFFALYAVFFWIIGIMGLFTPGYNKFVHSPDCSAEFIADNSKPPAFMFTHYCGERDGKAIEAVRNTSDAEVFISDGEYVRDQTAERRRKIYRTCSAIARIAVIILIFTLIF